MCYKPPDEPCGITGLQSVKLPKMATVRGKVAQLLYAGKSALLATSPLEVGRNYLVALLRGIAEAFMVFFAVVLSLAGAVYSVRILVSREMITESSTLEDSLLHMGIGLGCLGFGYGLAELAIKFHIMPDVEKQNARRLLRRSLLWFASGLTSLAIVALATME